MHERELYKERITWSSDRAVDGFHLSEWKDLMIYRHWIEISECLNSGTKLALKAALDLP